MGGKVLVPTQEAVEKLMAARFAADADGCAHHRAGPPRMLKPPTCLTSDCDADDRPLPSPASAPARRFYRVKNGLEQAISRGVAYAPYADLVWCETGVPDIGFAREFAQLYTLPAWQAAVVQLLAFVQLEENLRRQPNRFVPRRVSALGYKFQFITLAGIHINWYNTFQFAHAYARGEGMKHYVNMVQEP